MADEFVTLTLGRVFKDFRRQVEALQDDILLEGAQVLRREEETSIRQRWFRTGATVNSLQEELVIDGNKKTYLLFPTATNKGAPYPLFGEYGTGRLGAQTGRPAPRGYRYGSKAGMAARRFSRIAVSVARPQIDRLALQRVKQFVTVNKDDGGSTTNSESD
jgi:hypothetical protein